MEWARIIFLIENLCRGSVKLFYESCHVCLMARYEQLFLNTTYPYCSLYAAYKTAI